MPIHGVCPSCHKEYDLSTQFAGKRVRCKACQASFPVPCNAAFKEVVQADDEKDVAPPPPAKSRLWLYLLAGGAAVLLLLVGCGAAGVAAWFYSYRSPNPVAVAPTPNPSNDQKPSAQPDPDDEPLGPKLDADPLREPMQPPSNPQTTLPLPFNKDDVTYPWVPGPVVAFARPGEKNERVWEVWNVQSMKLLGAVARTNPTKLMVSADGAYVSMPIYGSARLGFAWATMEFFTVADGKSVRKVQVDDGKDWELGIAEFAGPGQFLTVKREARGGDAKLWDVKTGDPICRFKVAGHVDRNFTAVSPGGRYLAIVDDNGLIRINVYELTTGKVVRSVRPKLPLSQYHYGYHGLAFSNDGKELAVLLDEVTTGATADKSYLQAWDYETGKRTADHKFSPPLVGTAARFARQTLDPAVLQCLPDRSGWFVYEQLMIDHARGKVFWTLPPDDPDILWERRFLDANHLMSVAVKSPESRQLVIITLPKDEIAAARKK